MIYPSKIICSDQSILNIGLWTLFLIFSFTGCDSTEYVNEIDSVLAPVDQTNFQNIPFSTIKDSTWSIMPDRGETAQNLVGKFDIFESAILLKFNIVTSFPETTTISQIFLEMTVATTIGDSTLDAIGVSMSKNTIAWTEDNISDLTFDDYINAATDLYDSVSAPWRTTDSTTHLLSFRVTKSVYQTWKDGSDTNGVLIFGSGSGGFIISSPSRTSGLINPFLPVIRINHTEDGESITSRFAASSDGITMKISEDLTVTDPERIYVGGAAAHRAFILFSPDLIDLIPKNALISKGEFTLSIDYDKSILPFLNSTVSDIDLSFELRLGLIDSLSSTGVPIKINRNDSLKITVPLTGSILTINLAPVVQQWVAGNFDNLGIAIWSSGEHSQIFRISFVSGNSIDDDALKPKLEIFYIDPPDFRNEN